jgi:hypothetical protein
LSLFWPTAMIWPKSQNYKIGHDCILSIGNFILVIKNHILLFQLPGNCPTTKKCAPYFRGNMEFPIYLRIKIPYWNLPLLRIIESTSTKPFSTFSYEFAVSQLFNKGKYQSYMYGNQKSLQNTIENGPLN